MNVKELPPSERPRERLKNQGVGALSVQELLAILLTTGTKKASVLDFAAQILSHFGSLKKLMHASIEELMEIKGLGLAKAVKLKAALGLAQKVQLTEPLNHVRIDALRAYELIRHELEILKQEVLMVILRDVKEKLISIETVSIGTLSEVLIHPREVFYPAVRHKACSLILAHNHPSGDPTPSQADIEMTHHLSRSGKIMGIHLEDHLIVGSSGYISLKQAGCFKPW
ncbi:MAG: DNA repair protein RadC [Candidatus Rhabdochlamydia sp.]